MNKPNLDIEKKKKKLKSSDVKTFERGKKSENLLALPRSFKYCKKLNPKI